MSKMLFPSKSLVRKLGLRLLVTAQRPLEKPVKNLAKHLAQRIKTSGPITVHEYMKEVLTNPSAGYYMNNDVFGAKGDFITSPEITQMFGEMIGVWFLNEWQKIGCPQPLQIVELGPGRGTLSEDIIRVFGHFKALHKTSLHLVEVSPFLSDLQGKKLCSQISDITNSKQKIYRTGIAKAGIPVSWYRKVDDVPKGFSFFIAHEFFDALPIHKFSKTYNGYKEILIDLDMTESTIDQPKFRYVLSKFDTPMTKTLIKSGEGKEHLEIAPSGLLITENICKRLIQSGGIALICDYGHFGLGIDTFRAFSKHKQVDPLENPGGSDLTADVDFSLLKNVADKVGDVLCLGPVKQRDFLLKVGMEYRFKALSRQVDNAALLQNLQDCYDMLIDEDKMGARFKFFAMVPKKLKKIVDRYPIVGF